MNDTVKTFNIGRLFIGLDFARRGTRWMTYEGRKRREHIFSISRVYDRVSKLYVWHLMMYKISLAIGWLRGK